MHLSKHDKLTQPKYMHQLIMYHLKRSQRADPELKEMIQQLSDDLSKVCNSYIFLFLDENQVMRSKRAIHLEVTESMDMRAFTNALTRFVAMRRMPTNILSDNWKTFHF